MSLRWLVCRRVERRISRINCVGISIGLALRLKILDATNTTRDRRKLLMEFCKNLMHEPPFRVFFVESVCDDPVIINSNITHGESEYNQIGRLGGDSPLSANGLKYAGKLREYFENEDLDDFRVWSSQKIRAAQTAAHLKDLAGHTEFWKCLDEIDAGICEGLTYEDFESRYPKQFAERDKDKYHYRYPSGESYEDLVARLEPVIMELERQSNVLVISHQAVLRCILAYFTNKNRDDLPYLKVPLHTVIKLTPKAYSCEVELFKFDINAVDTYREKPK
ncbi:hypothetical protein CRE_15768 [Caenorhabditis remanei]|uniref:Uncharacterized protein n=1 Tax=Caenorhabditis remanei TaxID=31234 RepID=E3NKD2_CAERE|nr:hypothetical protein CRE_15768 [Caenorhabditis remanei]